MSERPKINLKQHALPPVSRKYLIRVIVYIVFLIIAGLLIYQIGSSPTKNKTSIDDVEVIDHLTIAPAPSHN